MGARDATPDRPEIPDGELRAIERMAVELANLAGAEIRTALGSVMAVKYKSETLDEYAFRDPVSEVDHRVETLIRTRLAERFPEHDIIGEEMDERPGRDHDFVWAVDPIDGTANFVNGFPLFAASIGVLHKGGPIAAALWCSTSHRMRPGVYHARQGGQLRFDGEAAEAEYNPAVRRGLIGLPDAGASTGPWDTRRTGSAAIECALVAAGLLRAARFDHPNIWDVAGGAALVLAAGGEVWMETDQGWQPMQRFEPMRAAKGASPDLRNWRKSIMLGSLEALNLMCGQTTSAAGA